MQMNETFQKLDYLLYHHNILPPKIQYKAYQDKVYPSDVVMDIIQWHDIIYDDVILHTKQRKY